MAYACRVSGLKSAKETTQSAAKETVPVKKTRQKNKGKSATMVAMVVGLFPPETNTAGDASGDAPGDAPGLLQGDHLCCDVSELSLRPCNLFLGKYLYIGEQGRGNYVRI